MKEEFLHYLWQYQFFEHDNLVSVQGQKIIIEKCGNKNIDSGPDFFNAKIKIADTLWVGNVEIHVNSSNWYLHNHHKDKAYDNVILHVVMNNDCTIKRSNGQVLPTLELKGKFSDELYSKYEKMLIDRTWVSCENDLKKVDDFIKMAWIDRLMIERLERKASYLSNLYQQANESWEETFYWFMARSFGFNVNAEPFELLAKSIPLKLLVNNKHSLFQLEALLFGQAGFLNEDLHEDFAKELRKTYHLFQKKHHLRPLDVHWWKFSRLRPHNFPSIRIAQFAAFLFSKKDVFKKLIEVNNLKDLYSFFDFQTSGYWTTHFRFFNSNTSIDKGFGKKSADSILINALVPALFFYGKIKNEELYQQRAMEFLNEIQGERNNITSKWKELGMNVASAINTQGLLELKNQYCSEKKCLNCSIGIDILKKQGL
jgi:hypothetical protein